MTRHTLVAVLLTLSGCSLDFDRLQGDAMYHDADAGQPFGDAGPDDGGLVDAQDGGQEPAQDAGAPPADSGGPCERRARWTVAESDCAGRMGGIFTDVTYVSTLEDTECLGVIQATVGVRCSDGTEKYGAIVVASSPLTSNLTCLNPGSTTAQCRATFYEDEVLLDCTSDVGTCSVRLERE